ncbi:hypothetical protein D6779_10970, partial [Candidatus Parcubacteria bacterium]
KRANDEIALSGTQTFTRASTATYVDPLDGLVKTAAIDEPRFERMADGGVGILLEGGSTNEVIDSNNFANWSVWTDITITPNAGAGPDGQATSATLLTEGVQTAVHSIYGGTITFAVGDVRTFSIFVKPNGRTNFRFGSSNNVPWGVGKYATFDVVAGTVTTNDPAAKGKIDILPNGWYRLQFTTPPATAAGVTNIEFYLADAAGNATYLGDGVSGAYIYGVQSELLPFATSYIPTTTTTVTRAADALELSVAGNLLWANGSRSMSIMMDADALGDAGSAYWQRLLTTDQSLFIRRGNADAGLTTFAGNGPLYATTPSIVDGAAHRIGLIVDAAAGLTSSWVDGVQAASGVMGVNAKPVESRLIIGSGINGNQSWFGHIRNFRIYDRALTDAEIAAA